MTFQWPGIEEECIVAEGTLLRILPEPNLGRRRKLVSSAEFSAFNNIFFLILHLLLANVELYLKRRTDAVATLGNAALSSTLKKLDIQCAKQLFFTL